ncbi:hypothetical protein EC957_009426 [Mortierella hygrophila]|uniref:F-box domain-containing protein n=1 Tax=Mortierella hygrophila TaxID=979708 RepID=A0A9P6EX50_9FUNG|nr:hypothetical protein EC957_009426 [Mortierella hygrophila]
MIDPLIEKNPLQIPEIRARVSRLVSLKDAISCVRVSKAWSKDFALPIWCAVDFDSHDTFEDLDSDIVTKHGHHIRTIKNLTTQSQLNAVLRPTIKNVRVLQVTCATNARFRTLCMDLINNSSRSLEKLTLEMDANAKQQDYSSRMISVNAFVSSSASQLAEIRLHGICFGRDSFASLLRNCPLLTYVDLQLNVTLFSGPSIDAFQHKGVVTLLAPVKQVFKPDPESEPSSLGFSLLVHFPNLTNWHCYNLPTTLFVPVERIKSEVAICCPQVTMIDTWKSPQRIIYDLVANAFHGLTHVTFAYIQLSVDVVVAFLCHKATLLQIITFRGNNNSHTERDDAPSEDDHFQQSGRAVQLLPRSCPHLKVLEFEGHEMDMEIMEEEAWACLGLQRLRVRIRGLDTKDKIDRSLNLWKEGKQGPQQQKEAEAKDTSIEARVASHLLAFKKLKAVWLGTRTFYA